MTRSDYVKTSAASFVLVLLLAGWLPCGAAEPDALLPAALLEHPSKMKFPPLELHPPRPERLVLPNGLVVHFLEDHELPLIGLGAIGKGGSWLDPDDKLGLADLTGSTMRLGGSRSYPPDKMNDELEFVAARVETSIGMRSAHANLSCLTKDFDRVLAIFADVLRHPAFDPEKVELRRNQIMDSIRRRNDEPGPIASRHLNSKVYRGHPFGRILSLETVDRITRDDLIAFHRRVFVPNNLILGVAGDFDKAEMTTKLKAAFSSWAKGPPVEDPPDVPLAFEPAVFHVEKDVPQANIRMAHLGIEKTDPDLFALDVMDFILGGSGFTSRLMREIRSNQGLAYSVGSYSSAGQERGSIGLYCQTKNSTTVKSIRAMRELAHGMTTAPVTAEELKIAKDSILNSFVFEFQSSSQIVSQAISLEYQGLPPDFLEVYNDRISKVTADDVLAVAKKHLFPDKMVLVVVGKQSELDQPLSTLGKVTELPLEDFTEFDRKKAAAGKEKPKGK